MRRRLSEREAAEKARAWAKELFAMTRNVRCVWVQYEPSVIRGRRRKKSVVDAERVIHEACERGDIDTATQAMESLSHLNDPGMAVCTCVAQLTEVLTERLLRGEYCYVDSILGKSAVSLVVWSE